MVAYKSSLPEVEKQERKFKKMPPETSKFKKEKKIAVRITCNITSSNSCICKMVNKVHNRDNDLLFFKER